MFLLLSIGIYESALQENFVTFGGLKLQHKNSFLVSFHGVAIDFKEIVMTFILCMQHNTAQCVCLSALLTF